MIFASEINQIPEFYTIFARKMPEFYVIIARKIFFPDFFWGGGHVPPASVSYAYVLLQSIAPNPNENKAEIWTCVFQTFYEWGHEVDGLYSYSITLILTQTPTSTLINTRYL